MNGRIIEMMLSTRAKNCLLRDYTRRTNLRDNALTVDDVAELTREYVEHIPGIGAKSLQEIEALLKFHNKTFKAVPDPKLKTITDDSYISEIGLSKRIVYALERFYNLDSYIEPTVIRTVSDLKLMTDAELLAIDGIRKKSLEKIRAITNSI